MSNSPGLENRVVATAIGDADLEDYLSQLMFSQGWNIVHRSLDSDSLQRFYTDTGIGKSTLIYTTDFPAASPRFFVELADRHDLTLVNIDSVPTNAHALMSHIRQQLRVPLIHSGEVIANDSETLITPQVIPEARQRNIVVTGTTGAPGRTTIALALARHFAQSSPVELLDADTSSPCLRELVTMNESSNIQVSTLDPALRPRELAASDRLRIIDLGALGRMSTEVTDRRWQANLRTNVMEKSATAFYAAPASEMGLKRISNFVAELPLLINKSNLVFLLNKAGSGKADRAIIARFEALVQGHAWGKITLDYALHSPALPFSLRENRFTKEVAKIATLVKGS
jgi:hypothetical protein